MKTNQHKNTALRRAVLIGLALSATVWTTGMAADAPFVSTNPEQAVELGGDDEMRDIEITEILTSSGSDKSNIAALGGNGSIQTQGEITLSAEDTGETNVYNIIADGNTIALNAGKEIEITNQIKGEESYSQFGGVSARGNG